MPRMTLRKGVRPIKTLRAATAPDGAVPGRGARPALAAAMLAGLACAGPAAGHVSEGGIVLLLPTDLYIAAGVASVAATVVLLAAVPAGAVRRLFAALRLWPLAPGSAIAVTRGLSLALFAALLWLGLTGPRDPLANPLPLTVWVVWWIALVTVQGLVGDIWRWVTPFAAPLALTGRPLMRYPSRFGHAPGLVLLLVFAGFVLADPAPTDPARLASIAGGYWGLTALALALFGRRWLVRGEAITLMMRTYGRNAALGRRGGRVALGLPGWRIAAGPVRGLGAALFAILLLGIGSFDGLNETFWWFGLIGINPLEFPGRSEVIAQTVAGLVVTNLLLVAVFAGFLWAGLRLARAEMPLGRAVCLFAPSLLPIALGYHVAHYLTVLLVDAQYALAALSDPLARGDDLLGLGTFYVTTGFFNTPDTVRAIFLTQAGAVVIGHILAILVADALALRALPTRRAAFLSQVPLAAFMIAYTLFGLWLLASPKGL